MFRIEKSFAFSAAHQLHGLPTEHPCSRLHGHNYEVTLVLESSTLNEVGFVRDYRELDQFKQWIDNIFDHHHLNDFEEHIGGNPTAENLAKAIYLKAATWYPELASVCVKETPKTSAWYMPEVLPAVERVISALENLAEEEVTSDDRDRVARALLSLVHTHAKA
jgi:6-pyruvoyltetrahydropterin/6-carboxytetrahydropterin synthase